MVQGRKTDPPHSISSKSISINISKTDDDTLEQQQHAPLFVQVELMMALDITTNTQVRS
jgi:hypothetical protein